MKTRDVGVVIPVYNRARSVVATLDSVARQTLLPARLVVVDDGSTDAIESTMADWLQRQTTLDDVVFLRQPNQGVAAARNAGAARLADCRFVAYLDSDDAWPDDFLERTHAALLGAPDAVAATTDRYCIRLDGSARYHSLAEMFHQPALSFMKYDAGVVSCSLFRTEPIHRLGGFPRNLVAGEDAALFLRLSCLGRWLHVPGAPATIDRSTPRLLGEATSLSVKYHDGHRRWAQVHEDFLNDVGWARVPRRPAECILAQNWYRAGRELMRHGQTADVGDCYRRSLHWNAWNVKTWFRYAGWLAKRPADHVAAILRAGDFAHR